MARAARAVPRRLPLTLERPANSAGRALRERCRLVRCSAEMVTMPAGARVRPHGQRLLRLSRAD
jgi:hypothetical protein